MKPICLLLVLAMAPAAGAQDKKSERKVEKKAQAAHKKATPEQIRKFNELQKKQAAEPKK